MKKVLFALAFGAMVTTSVAQELPVPSPSSKLEQRVGLTDITLEYSRPGVKGRKIFGELVPYDKVWRFGANKNTMITLSTDIYIDGKKLEKGTYSIFATPNAKEWTIAFNTDKEQWGAGNYSTDKDALSIKAEPKEHSKQESFTLEINNIQPTSAELSMIWDNVEIVIPFKVKTDEIALSNIDAAIKEGKDLDKVHYNAARYFHSTKKDDKKAMEHIGKSLKVKEGFRTIYLRAQIHLDAGKTKEAIKDGEKALKLAMAAEEKGWAEYIKGNLTKWSEKK